MNYLSQTFWSIATLITLFTLDEVHLDSFGAMTEEAIVILQSDPTTYEQSDRNDSLNRSTDYR